MNPNQQKVRIDKIEWWVTDGSGVARVPQPLCPIHHLRMEPVMRPYDEYKGSSNLLQCADCKDAYEIPRSFNEEKEYVINRIDAKIFKGMKTLNLDDESVPLVEENLSSDDKKYFVTGLLTKSKVALRLVIFAGEKGRK